MFFFGSILALLFGAATLILQVYSLSARNPYFLKASKKLLTLSFCIVFIPTLLLCYVQEDYGKLAVKAADAQHDKEMEEHKFVSHIKLRWRPGIAQDRAKIAAISSTIKKRLERAHRNDCTVEGGVDRRSAYTAIKSTSSFGFDSSKLHLIITEAVTPTLRLQPQITQTTFPAIERYDEIVSIRSVHTSQERIALSGYPEAPDGYVRMPWQDGFVYVSTDAHINDSYISDAKPYQKNSILLTLTPEGHQRMNAMAQYITQEHVQLAVIYKGKVRGVYDPQLCVTDQFIVSDIPETPQQIALDADILSQPRSFADIESTEFDYGYRTIPKDNSFPLIIYRILVSDKLNNLWLIVYAVLILAVSSFLVYLHMKTRPGTTESQF